jgi:hypothetical protein
MRNVFVLFGALSLAACATVAPAPAPPKIAQPWLPQAGPPQPLAVDPALNPDVFWLVRQIDTAKEGPNSTLSSMPIYGLFACYRQPASKPGSPQCWLAQYISRPEDLSWPGGVYMGTNGTLKPIAP